MTRCLLSFSQVVHLLRLNGLEESLGLNIGNVIRFVTKIEAGYKSADAVPFHNRSHAADCVQSTAYFLNQARVKAHLTPVDVFAMILAAAMHDHGHPGFNNAFLVNSRDELAILYNDASVLEMYAASPPARRRPAPRRRLCLRLLAHLLRLQHRSHRRRMPAPARCPCAGTTSPRRGGCCSWTR